MTRSVETPSFTFRLECVRDLRQRPEEHARELLLRIRGEPLLREAMQAVSTARHTGSGFLRRPGASGVATATTALSASPSVHGSDS